MKRFEQAIYIDSSKERKKTWAGGKNTKKERATRKRLFSVHSQSTLRDELIYCQICCWIIDNPSQAPQSTHSGVAAVCDRTGTRSSEIHIKQKETNGEGGVCFMEAQTQTVTGCFSAPRIRGGKKKKKGLQFSTWADFNLHTHPPPWLHPSLLPTTFRQLW